MSVHVEFDISDDGEITMTHRKVKAETEYRKTTYPALRPTDIRIVNLAADDDDTKTHQIMLGAKELMDAIRVKNPTIVMERDEAAPLGAFRVSMWEWVG